MRREVRDAHERTIGQLLNIFDRVDPQTSFALSNPTPDQIYKLICAKIDALTTGEVDGMRLLEDRHRVMLARADERAQDLEARLAKTAEQVAILEAENLNLT